MRFYTNKRYTTIAVYAGLVIAVNVLLIVAIFKFSAIYDILGKIISVMNPIIWGLVIAFLVNPVMVRLDKLLVRFVFKGKDKPRLCRGISVTVSEALFVGIVAGLLWVVIPELVNSINEIINNFSGIVDTVQSWINRLFRNNPKLEDFATDKLKQFSTDLDSLITRIQPMITNLLSGAWNFLTFLKNFCLGFIVSVYLLISKENLLAQTKKIIIANFKKSTCEKVMKISKQTNEIFSGFLGGKIIDSVIIGILCFIGLTIMDIDYTVMISVIIGITNIIPFFGPFIGAIPSAMFVLLVQPDKLLAFIIFVFILQQFDGNILGPKILGDSTGLPGFWVLVALFIGGGLFGFTGMVLSVPAFALIYSLVRENVEFKLKRKKLPAATSYYKSNVDYMYAKPKRRTLLTPDDLDKITIPPADEVNEANLDNTPSDKPTGE